MQIRLATRTLRLRQPLRTAHGTTTERHSVEIAISDQGLVGHGEAAPLPGFGLESFDDALHSLQEWANDHHKFPISPAARSLHNPSKSTINFSAPKAREKMWEPGKLRLIPRPLVRGDFRTRGD